MKGWFVAMLLCASLSSLTLPVVSALGISPANLTFAPLLPGGYAETSLLLSNPKGERVIVNIDIDTPWITLSPSQFNISPHSSQRVSLAISPPLDAEIRGYEQRLVLSSFPASLPVSVGNRLGLSLEVPVRFSVSGVSATSCVIGGLSAPPFESAQEFQARFTLQNNGNTRIAPRGTVEIDDISYPFSFSSETLSTQSNEYFLSLPLKVIEGEYAFTLHVEGCSNDLSSLVEVLPPGSLGSSGSFKRLSLPSVVTTGSIVTAEALFSNTGKRVVSAQFRGSVEKDGKIVTLLESEELLSQPETSLELNAVFVPETPGTYTVKGRILFGNGQSTEREEQLVVESDARSETASFFLPSLLFIMFFIIIVLFIGIKRKRRRRR